MNIDQTLQIIQFAYPQVYLACHTQHQRKRSTDHRLSARDSSILAHLDLAEPIAPAALARHLSVARSTLSEAIKRLTALGYTTRLERKSVAGNRGGVGVLLTQQGAEAIRGQVVAVRRHVDVRPRAIRQRNPHPHHRGWRGLQPTVSF